MSIEESLQDVAVRERQLHAHILCSVEYRKRVDRDLKRLVSMLYLAIALLLLIQGMFTYRAFGQAPADRLILMGIVSILGVLNCFLLIQTKSWLHRINEDWLAPQEKIALETLKSQRHEILNRLPRNGNESQNAGLN